MFISLIFPCHNEERAIPQVLPKAIQAKQSLLQTKGITGFEVLAVDDGSTDKSLERLKDYKNQIKIIPLKRRAGYGSAIKQGISQAKGDWIVFCDLDNSCDPRELNFFIKKIQESYSLPTAGLAGSKAQARSALNKRNLRYKFPSNSTKPLQAVWGSRLNKKSRMPYIRKLGNRLYQTAFFILSFQPVPDPCSGFRLFNKSAFSSAIRDFPSDLSFSLAFTAHCIRYKIPFSSVSVFYENRLGESKLHIFKDGWIFLLTLIKFLYF